VWHVRTTVKIKPRTMLCYFFYFHYTLSSKLTCIPTTSIQHVGELCFSPYGFYTLYCIFRLRSRVASGQAGQPPASNMLELTWDPELARQAYTGLLHSGFCSINYGH
jgi:hypothetical protein